MSFLKKTLPLGQWKARMLARLAAEIDTAKNAVAMQACTLGEGSVLLSEAEIGNFAGGAELIRVGKNSYIRGRLQTYGHGGRISIGDWCYVGIRSEIWSMNSIHIGDRVLIAHDVNIHDGTAHSLNADERHRHFRDIIERGHPRTVQDLPGVRSEPIVIEDDVWINFGVTIFKGVRIGRGSVISAGAVVTRDVPPGVLYKCAVTPVIASLES